MKIYEVKVYRKYFTNNKNGEEVSRWYRTSHLTQVFTNLRKATTYFKEKNSFRNWQKAVLRVKRK